jgi:hypothetical protein
MVRSGHMQATTFVGDEEHAHPVRLLRSFADRSGLVRRSKADLRRIATWTAGSS